jgi:hypothetical protein
LQTVSHNDVWAIVTCWHIEMRVTWWRNLALLVQGIIQSQSGCLSVIVRHWPQRCHTAMKRPGRLVLVSHKALPGQLGGFRLYFHA